MANDPAARYRTGFAQGGGGFQPYSAGPKRYGQAGLQAPNLGPVQDMSGYAKRDAEAAARRNLVLKRMQVQNGLKFTVM